MVRREHLIVIILAMLIALLYPSPAYAPPLHDTTAGDHYVSVRAGTPVTVLGLYRDPGYSGCDPPNAYPCRPHTYAVVQLPDGKVVQLHHKAVDYQTQTVRVDSNAAGPLTPKRVNDLLGLPGTGGAALLPLVGTVLLIGGALVLRRLLAMR